MVREIMMRHAKQLPGVAVVIFAALGAAPLSAGGLYIQEFATPSMGSANAGAEAWADNAGTAWHNPAGTTRLKQSEVALAPLVTDPGTELDAPFYPTISRAT